MYRILVVDDEKSIRETFGIFLKKEGYEVFLAEDVENALKIFDERNIDLIISDIIMPKVSGIEMLNIIKKKNADVSVIIMTGEPTVETAKKAVKDSAQDYLIKPVSKLDLLKTVKYALKNKKLIDDKKKLEIENLNYRDNLEVLVEKRTIALQEALYGTIATISGILELKDPYTAGHEKQVANLALAIAKKMNLTKEQQECIYFAGYLHDIGKLLLPSEILSKPGKLSKSEFTLIKDHVEIGRNLIKDINLPWKIAPIIYQHHERLDGSGYPNGVTGEDMTIESKILAVSDVVEAMSSHRPYRPKLSIEVALDEIEKNKGIKYDEEVYCAVHELFIKDGYKITSEDQNMRITIS